MYFRTMLLCLGGLLACPQDAVADQPAAFTDFKAKRIKPPGASQAQRPNPARKRITVQIDPVEQALVLAARPKPQALPSPEEDTAAAVAKPKNPGNYAWFWEAISPEITQSGPGRLTSALQLVSASGKVRAPRLQAMQDIAKAHGAPILRSTVGTSVSPALVLAVIAVESAGRSDAVSGAGAAGLMQLMPATAERFGVTDRLAAADNITGGVKYLNWLMKEFGNDPILVLAGYNAGEGSVKNYKGVPPYPETRDYVPKVLAAFQVASGLCRTPPELISDGCVFAAMN